MHDIMYSIVFLNKVMPPVCTKYYAVQGKSQVVNIVQGEAEYYICHNTLTKDYIFYTVVF